MPCGSWGSSGDGPDAGVTPCAGGVVGGDGWVRVDAEWGRGAPVVAALTACVVGARRAARSMALPSE
jgi:hypothetical protein